MKLNRDTRIIDLTLGQFMDWMAEQGFQPKKAAEGVTGKNWVYGTAGVRALFGWSEAKTLRNIHGVLAPAVLWTGPRKYQVDADMAKEILKSNNQK